MSLPVVVALALGGPTRARRHAWPGSQLHFATVAVVGTQDALRFNQSVRDTWQALADNGVLPSDIDVWYVGMDGRSTLTPRTLPRDRTAQDVPWIMLASASHLHLSTSGLDW